MRVWWAGFGPGIAEGLYHFIKKAVAERKHLERNMEDKDSNFRLVLIESRVHRLARYYERTKKLLPPGSSKFTKSHLGFFMFWDLDVQASSLLIYILVSRPILYRLSLHAISYVSGQPGSRKFVIISLLLAEELS